MVMNCEEMVPRNGGPLLKVADRAEAWHRGYKESMQGVRRRLLQRTAKEGGLLYVAELHGTALVRKMDHLVCFLPGTPPPNSAMLLFTPLTKHMVIASQC